VANTLEQFEDVIHLAEQNFGAITEQFSTGTSEPGHRVLVTHNSKGNDQ
jgi:hypothetical protein